jgi:hypothetical protein
MGTVEGYVTVYEFTESNPGNFLWQFFVDPGGAPQSVTTADERFAETMRLAVKTSATVRVSYNDVAPHNMEQARIVFNYICEEMRLTPCRPTGGPGEPIFVCITRRYSRCDPKRTPELDPT